MDNAVSSRFDLNGDGAVDLKDLAYAAKVAGVTVSAAATAVGVTAAVSAAAGAALVSTQAASFGAGIAAAGGAIVGTAAGFSAGTTTFGLISVTQIGSALLIETIAFKSVSTAAVAAWASTTTVVAATTEIASGYIAGLPIVKSAALASLKASGEVVVIGGIPFGVNTAIVAGIVTAVVVGAMVFYLLTDTGHNKLLGSRIDLNEGLTP